MATAPLMALLMLGDLGFSPLEYGLAFVFPGLSGLAPVFVGQFGLVASPPSPRSGDCSPR